MARSKHEYQRVTAVNIDSAIAELLEEYGDEVYEVLSDAVEEVTDKGIEKLKAVSKFSPDGKPSGDYSNDWMAEDIESKRIYKSRVIYNYGHYQLTHLLEYGHVSRNGTGRTFDPVPAYPHIKPVEEWMSSELPKKVKELISKI